MMMLALLGLVYYFRRAARVENMQVTDAIQAQLTTVRDQLAQQLENQRRIFSIYDGASEDGNEEEGTGQASSDGVRKVSHLYAE